VESAEMRSYKVRRKGSSHVSFAKRKCLQHRKDIIKCPVQPQIFGAPVLDGNIAHTVAVLECENQILSE
jgi:hypothetical protein